jgi:SWI/SNF-related matrix-associated actin-dependent regulator of chromatin subfamily A3
MALTERDRNQTVARKQDGKRKRVEIDLTGDSDDSDDLDAPLRKTQKSNTQPKDSQPQSDRNVSAASQHSNNNRGGHEPVYGSSGLNGTQHHSETERDAWLADDEDDVNEIIRSTQAAAAETEHLEEYGTLATKIVGVQYYRGYASAGEQAVCRREPGT